MGERVLITGGAGFIGSHLADANRCGAVKDGVHAGQCLLDDVAVAHIAPDELDVRREIGGWSIRGAVHLRQEIIENADFVTGIQQLIGQVRSDESCSPGDQHSFTHVWHPPRRGLCPVNPAPVAPDGRRRPVHSV